MKKKSKRKVSPVVLRAIARINDYENKKKIIQFFVTKNQLTTYQLPRE